MGREDRGVWEISLLQYYKGEPTTALMNLSLRAREAACVRRWVRSLASCDAHVLVVP